MLIMGIETSCDETAVSLVNARDGEIKVLSNTVSSQTKIHSRWGGVVPNLAAREHLKNIIPVMQSAFFEAKVKPQNIDLIAVTQGPGLIPALLIGTNVAKTLSYVWQKPLLGIHHTEGHIYANFIREVKSQKLKVKSDIKFPILCLVVSGGHTQLILMKKHLDYQIVGETLDDATGEAFDKVARILNLGYPGGPAIAAKAAQFAISNLKKGYKKYKLPITNYKLLLPRPMINSNNLNMSFSGLKTAVLYEVKKNPNLLKDKNYISAMCREFQQAVIDVLISKTLKAAKTYKLKTIMLAGGVSANQELRKQLGKAVKKTLPLATYNLPQMKYSIDNAAMIAVAGFYRWKFINKTQRKKSRINWKILQPDANLKLK